MCASIWLAGNYSVISIHFSLENNKFFLYTRKNVQQLSQKKKTKVKKRNLKSFK